MNEPQDTCDLLVVAAFAPELVGLQGLLGAAMKATVGSLVVAARPVGIGMVAAASGTAARLARCRPRAVILVGTCGAYPGTNLATGDIVVARSTLLVEPAVIDEEAAFPDPMSARVEAHAAMSAAVAAAGARVDDIATTLAVTTSDALASRLARESGAAVEHLEAFAVATACALQGVPFAAALAVANTVGSLGRDQWRAHHEAAGGAAATFLARWILSGAAGVPYAGGTGAGVS